MNLDPVIHGRRLNRVSPGSYHVGPGGPGTLPLRMAHSRGTRVFVHVTSVSKQEKLPPMCTPKNCCREQSCETLQPCCSGWAEAAWDEHFPLEQDGSGSHQAATINSRGFQTPLREGKVIGPPKKPTQNTKPQLGMWKMRDSQIWSKSFWKDCTPGGACPRFCNEASLWLIKLIPPK